MSDPFELLARARPSDLDDDVDTTQDPTAAAILTRVLHAHPQPPQPPRPPPSRPSPPTRRSRRHRPPRDRARVFALTVSVIAAAALLAALVFGRDTRVSIDASPCPLTNPSTQQLLDCLAGRVALITSNGHEPSLAIAAEGGYLVSPTPSTPNDNVVVDIAGAPLEVPARFSDLATDLTAFGPNPEVAKELTPAFSAHTRTPAPTPGSSVVVVNGSTTDTRPLTLTATIAHVVRTFRPAQSTVTYIEVAGPPSIRPGAFIVDQHGRLLGIIETSTGRTVIAIAIANAAVALPH